MRAQARRPGIHWATEFVVEWIPGSRLSSRPGMTAIIMERTMPWPDPITLRGQHARLEPLSKEHLLGLTEAVKDGELSKLWYTAIPLPENMGKEIDRRLGLQAAGSMLPFTVFDAGGKHVL